MENDAKGLGTADIHTTAHTRVQVQKLTSLFNLVLKAEDCLHLYT